MRPRRKNLQLSELVILAKAGIQVQQGFRTPALAGVTSRSPFIGHPLRNLPILLGVLVVFAATMAFAAEIKPSDVAGTPSVYCRVVKEPNPLLLGHFGCVHRKLNEETDEYVMEPIEYWLLKTGEKYALYFYRVKDGRGKKFRGWRKWYLEGDRLNSESMAYVFVKDGDVYYGWRNDKPTRMTRIE